MTQTLGMGPVVVVDNYDSFTYNLVQYLGELGASLEVWRNDQIAVQDLLARRPLAIVISPGPGRPEQAGISVELIRQADAIPVLGVCLGHQAIAVAFGGRVVASDRLLHGKASPIHHDGRTIFEGLPDPFEAGRYHSLCVAREGLPAELEVSAVDETGCIMGLRHRERPVEGVQFHPESVLTGSHGKQMLRNFLAMAQAWQRDRVRANR
ncbi:aminodeoxychorismate/anthranilate synthase component II [Geochorda subterranea]|uniref:Aminodeoxychorismate/anthranilate synthase component II n=2 Tax=Geochorda subterranea TaxID=3109564 RepID=A0ABZ1BK68_9FIRM|nr:aminodeoxychorismate/anthranilate synthase component II [Limnochorda sp. LNt]WRP13269.1 aminodeoxychorismate/anthranilate synthase component II [Limnochorda sp. LNt]